MDATHRRGSVLQDSQPHDYEHRDRDAGRNTARQYARALRHECSKQQPGTVGDPIMQMVWPPGTLIDPQRYRILTVEFGVPNAARSVNTGSVARIAWRVAGGTDSVSDDIIFNSRVGANVLDKIIVDMADRATLPIEQGVSAGLGARQLGNARHRPVPLRRARVQQPGVVLRQAHQACRLRTRDDGHELHDSLERE